MTFSNLSERQNLNFILSAIDGDVKDIKLEIDNYKEIIIPIVLKEGETIKLYNGTKAILYNNNWQKIKEISLDPVVLTSGEHSVNLECNFMGEKETKLMLEMRISEKEGKVISK